MQKRKMLSPFSFARTVHWMSALPASHCLASRPFATGQRKRLRARASALKSGESLKREPRLKEETESVTAPANDCEDIPSAAEKLRAWKRPVAKLETAQEKASSKRTFFTSVPVVLAETNISKVVSSMQSVGVGLFAYTNYAMFFYWNGFGDWLLPGLFVYNLLCVWFVRSVGFNSIAKLTLLPKYRLRFDRYGWFGRVRPKHSVEFYFKDIENVTYNKKGYSFFTPLRKSSVGLPMFLFKPRSGEFDNEELLNALVKLYEKEKAKFAVMRLNRERKGNLPKPKR